MKEKSVGQALPVYLLWCSLLGLFSAVVMCLVAFFADSAMTLQPSGLRSIIEELPVLLVIGCLLGFFSAAFSLSLVLKKDFRKTLNCLFIGTILMTVASTAFVMILLGRRDVFLLMIPCSGILAFVGTCLYLNRTLPDMYIPGHCSCGYDLTGNESGACPECGKQIITDES